MFYRCSNDRGTLGYWMPFLRIPRTIKSSVFDAPDERVIAQARFVLCLISLLAVHIDPTQPAQYATAATLVLTAYAALSAGLVALTYTGFLLRRHSTSFTLQIS